MLERFAEKEIRYIWVPVTPFAHPVHEFLRTLTLFETSWESAIHATRKTARR
jgi:hypothetical protein